jgi:putative transposase
LPLRDEEQNAEARRMNRRKMLLPKVVGYFKMNSSKQINLLNHTEGNPVWHRNYYEHIISNDEEYATIAAYIESNPENWVGKDEYYDADGEYLG